MNCIESVSPSGRVGGPMSNASTCARSFIESGTADRPHVFANKVGTIFEQSDFTGTIRHDRRRTSKYHRDGAKLKHIPNACLRSAMVDARRTPGAPIRRSETFARTGTDQPSESNISEGSVEAVFDCFFVLTSFHSVAGRTFFGWRTCGACPPETIDCCRGATLAVGSDDTPSIKDVNAPERSNAQSCGTI